MFNTNNFNTDESSSGLDENINKVVETEELIVPNTLVPTPFTNLALSNNWSLKLALKFPSAYNSDLIPGIYEGGFKLWECTIDLLDYLSKNTILFNGKSVLDLGCGTGALGVFTLIAGAQSVDFQDFNQEVLTSATMNNVLLNCPDKLKLCRYYSGDWKSFTDFNKNTYDLILTSETIYNVKNYSKLIKLFEKKLKPSGCILLIAKNYYFGVGGSINEFFNFLDSSEMNIDTIWTSTDGVKKTLLKIQF